MQGVMVDRDPSLKAVEFLGPNVNGQVDGLAVVLVREVLDWNVRLRGRAAVGDFGYPMQSQGAGGYKSGCGNPDVVRWQNATIVFIGIHDGAADRGLEILCAMKRCV